MPANQQERKQAGIVRLMLLADTIRRHKTMTRSEIYQSVGEQVSTRTVRRDLEVLRKVGWVERHLVREGCLYLWVRQDA